MWSHRHSIKQTLKDGVSNRKKEKKSNVSKREHSIVDEHSLLNYGIELQVNHCHYFKTLKARTLLKIPTSI